MLKHPSYQNISSGQPISTVSLVCRQDRGISHCDHRYLPRPRCQRGGGHKACVLNKDYCFLHIIIICNVSIDMIEVFQTIYDGPLIICQVVERRVAKTCLTQPFQTNSLGILPNEYCFLRFSYTFKSLFAMFLIQIMYDQTQYMIYQITSSKQLIYDGKIILKEYYERSLMKPALYQDFFPLMLIFFTELHF